MSTQAIYRATVDDEAPASRVELESSGPFYIVYPNPFGEPLVLDVQGASLTPGAEVIVHVPNGGPLDGNRNQQWSVRPAGNASYYFLFNENSGLVLDALEKDTHGNVPLMQWSLEGTDSPKWFFVTATGSFGPAPTNTYYIVNKYSGKVLDVRYLRSSGAREGDAVVQEKLVTPNETHDQRWYLANDLGAIIGI